MSENRRNWLVDTAIAVAATIGFWLVSRGDFRIEYDSLNYLASADSLARGAGYLGFNGHFMPSFPGGYAMAVAGVHLISGLDVLVSARLLAAICTGVIALSASRLVRTTGRNTTMVAPIAALLIGFSPVLYSVSHHPMSEPLFLAFTLGGLAAFARWLSAPTPTFLTWSAIWLGLAALTRYQGVYTVMILCAWLVLSPGVERRWRNVTFFGALSAIPLTAWVGYAKIVSGAVTQVRQPSPQGVVELSARSAKVFKSWLSLDYSLDLPSWILFGSFVTLAGAALLFLFLGRRAFWFKLPAFVIGVTVIETIITIVMRFTVRVELPTTRILLLSYVLGVVMMAVAASYISYAHRWVRPLVVSVALVAVAITSTQWYSASSDRAGFVIADISDAATASICALPRDTYIASNTNEYLVMDCRRYIELVPKQHFGNQELIAADWAENDMRRAGKCTVVAWHVPSGTRNYLWPYTDYEKRWQLSTEEVGDWLIGKANCG